MNKTEMIERLAQKTGMTKADSQKALEGVLEVVSEELKSGNSVALTGFGTFTVTERKPRTGRNPRTGAEINIPAARVPKFKPGKNLKEAVS